MLLVFFVLNCELIVESLRDIVMGKHKWNFLIVSDKLRSKEKCANQ